MSMFSWTLVHNGRTPGPGEVVRPDERLSTPRMVGLGAQHVVAMFGATFVFPAIMGLSPNLAVLMSGVATVLFLLIVKNKVPSYVGTSASFVAGVTAMMPGMLLHHTLQPPLSSPSLLDRRGAAVPQSDAW